MKVYHIKCLEEDDVARLRKSPNDWRCDDCFKKDKYITNKQSNSNKAKINEIVSKVTIDEKSQKFIFQTRL